jgi:hypothetical protein
MDDLDRLYDRLVASIRDGFPHLVDRAFQLGDIPEHLVAYRLNRRELGFDSVRQYELALMRLAAGERGYLRADAAVQDAFRRALQSPEPDAALLRDHARASVALGQGGAKPAAAPEPTQEPAAAPTPAEPAPETPAPVIPPIPVPAIETTMWGDPVSGIEPAQVRDAPPRPAPVATAGERPGLGERPGPTVIGGPCRYCGQALPEGRRVTYCPHCGQNVTVRHCPACSTELEVGWHFCITCGRAMDDAGLTTEAR